MNQRGIVGILGLGFGGWLLSQSIYTVHPGHMAVVFSKLTGLKQKEVREGWHLKVPYFERPYIFNVQTKPTQVRTLSANKDLQNVNLGLRVLFRPRTDKLQELYRYCGKDYDDRVLPSLVNEVLKNVIAQYTASELLTKRDQISFQIRKNLEERAQNFFIVIDDVSITDLTFSKEYNQAVEAKQVAQQEAERAKFLVQTALEQKKSVIIKATGEAKSIELVGKASQNNPAYLDLRKIEYAIQIGDVLSQGKNIAYLDSSQLLLDLKKNLASLNK